MPEDHSTLASMDAPAYFPAFLHDPQRVHVFRKVIRARPGMTWARARSLNDDFEQLGLLEVAKIVRSFDPSVGPTVEQYVGVALRTRLFSCLRSMASAYKGVLTPEDANQDSDEDHAYQAKSTADEGTSTTQDDVEKQQLTLAIRHAVSRLPNRQREVMELMLSDHTEREIATELGVSIQADKTKQGAVKALKQSLAAFMQ